MRSEDHERIEASIPRGVKLLSRDARFSVLGDA